MAYGIPITWEHRWSQGIRGDRKNDGGGVLIAARDEIQLKLNEIKTKANCEIRWGEVQTDNGSTILGAFYRPPRSDIEHLNHLDTEIQLKLEKGVQ